MDTLSRPDDLILVPDQLARVESLGDNCELGFVLRDLGISAGSLFRWASMKPPQLLALLKADFAGLYEFADLSPLRLSMVEDRRYGIGWHTEMASVPADGGLRFRDGEAVRRMVHRRELRKLRYLLAKFEARARAGGALFVVKSNPGIDPAVVRGIHGELLRIARGAPFALLEVAATDEPSLVGTVEAVAPGLMRGHAAGFAPYERADEGDRAVWASLLGRALALHPCPDWEARAAAAQDALVDPSVRLRFPPTGEAEAEDCVLVNGNAWCRAVGDDFRLHGPAPGSAATMLRWNAGRLGGPHFLSGSVRAAIPQSLPVDLVVRSRDAGETDIRERRFTVSPDRPVSFELPVDAEHGEAVVIELAVLSSRPLGEGDRAVVDVAPLTLHPAG